MQMAAGIWLEAHEAMTLEQCIHNCCPSGDSWGCHQHCSGRLDQPSSDTAECIQCL